MSDIDETTLPGVPIKSDAPTPRWVRELAEGQRRIQEQQIHVLDAIEHVATNQIDSSKKLDQLTTRVGTLETRQTIIPVVALVLSFAAFVIACLAVITTTGTV